ncbi:MAG: LysR family transcriptional regulator [Ruminococcaceae bacterium]|nr:LysR family transcriptional regulator [Oscillospiraceae bacterium]
MELRVLQYFLAVTREQSISGAAESLYLSQPTLSRQLKELEEELGKQLFIRGSRRITLTEEGMILRKRAEEIIELVKRAEDEITQSDETIAGDITVGTGETDGLRFLARAARSLQTDYPLIHLNIISGDKARVMEELDRGLIDFGIVFGDIDTSKYEFIRLPHKDIWGVMMRRDSPLAQKREITADDLIDKPLIISRQSFHDSAFREFFRCDQEKLNVVATYNLLFNGSIMVDEGMGYAICLDKIINVSGDSSLCFRPLSPIMEASMNIIWKKYQVHSKAIEKFLERIRSETAAAESASS